MATSGRDAEGKPLLNDGSFAGMLSRYGFGFEEKDGNGFYTKLDSMVQQTLFAEPLYNAMVGIVRLNEGIVKWTDKSYSRSMSAANWAGGSYVQETPRYKLHPTMPSYSHDGVSLRCQK